MKLSIWLVVLFYDNRISDSEVELHLELPPRLDEEHGEVDIVRFDSEGFLKEPYKIGYFDYGYFNHI